MNSIQSNRIDAEFYLQFNSSKSMNISLTKLVDDSYVFPDCFFGMIYNYLRSKGINDEVVWLRPKKYSPITSFHKEYNSMYRSEDLIKDL